MKKIILLTCLLALVLCGISNAQRRGVGEFSRVDGFSVTAKGGLSLALGELDQKNTSWVAGIALNKGLAELLNLRVEFETGILTGQKADYYNSSFRTDFYQINIIPIFNLGRAIFEESKINLGIYAGIGMMRFNSAAYDLSSGRLQRVTSDAYSRHTTLFEKVGEGKGDQGIYYTNERAVPLGLLLSTPIGDRLNIGLDLRYNWVRTDKLDATSGSDRSAIYNNNGVNLLWGAKSYSDTPNDAWASVSLNLTYKFASQFSRFQRGV